jgi:UDP-N-acetylglucosamine--N-acetylmuramyl-(pentapeptide) pyrophosphoryl-undecaprenol N-acetylglucosamine transferase
MGEYPLFGLPAILIPYPHAWRYQKLNAQYLAERGAAVVLEDEKLKDRLPDMIKELIADQNRRDDMSAVMRTMHKPEAAKRIAGILLDLINQGEHRHG